MSLFAAATMLIALIMTLAFAGAESTPVGYDPARPVTLRAWAAPGTTFVAGLSAFLNISYTFIGQILIPVRRHPTAHPTLCRASSRTWPTLKTFRRLCTL